MKKPITKLTLTSSQREFLEIFGKSANRTYYWFPQIFKKIEGTNDFEELEMSELPEGIRKYIENYK